MPNAMTLAHILKKNASPGLVRAWSNLVKEEMATPRLKPDETPMPKNSRVVPSMFDLIHHLSVEHYMDVETGIGKGFCYYVPHTGEVVLHVKGMDYIHSPASETSMVSDLVERGCFLQSV